MRFAVFAAAVCAQSLDITSEEASLGDLDYIEAYGTEDMEYSKVVVYLHGGGMSGSDALGLLESGTFGAQEDIEGIKWIFPTANVGPETGTYYETYKEGADNAPEDCDFGVLDICAYSQSDMEE